MIYLIRLSLINTVVLLLFTTAFSQVQNRVIYLSEDDAKNYEHSLKDGVLEIVSLKIAGSSVLPSQVFTADENWLKNLKIRVKNISRKPIANLRLTFESLKKTASEFENPDSYRFDVRFSYEKSFRSRQKKTSENFLQPDEETELTYENISSWQKEILEKYGVNNVCCATRFFSAKVEFQDGEEQESLVLLFRKN